MYIKMFEAFKDEYDKIESDFRKKRTQLVDSQFSSLDDIFQSMIDKYSHIHKVERNFVAGDIMASSPQFSYIFTITKNDVDGFKKEVIDIQYKIGKMFPEFKISYYISTFNIHKDDLDTLLNGHFILTKGMLPKESIESPFRVWIKLSDM